MKYRMKPMEIQAIQWRYDGLDPVKNNFDDINKFCDGKCLLETFGGLTIGQNWNVHAVKNGDWIVILPSGYFSVYSESAFKACFELAEPIAGSPNRFG
jgi:hypothetical protein